MSVLFLHQSRGYIVLLISLLFLWGQRRAWVMADQYMEDFIVDPVEIDGEDYSWNYFNDLFDFAVDLNAGPAIEKQAIFEITTDTTAVTTATTQTTTETIPTTPCVETSTAFYTSTAMATSTFIPDKCCPPNIAVSRVSTTSGSSLPTCCDPMCAQCQGGYPPAVPCIGERCPCQGCVCCYTEVVFTAITTTCTDIITMKTTSISTWTVSSFVNTLLTTSVIYTFTQLDTVLFSVTNETTTTVPFTSTISTSTLVTSTVISTFYLTSTTVTVDLDLSTTTYDTTDVSPLVTVPLSVIGSTYSDALSGFFIVSDLLSYATTTFGTVTGTVTAIDTSSTLSETLTTSLTAVDTVIVSEAVNIFPPITISISNALSATVSETVTVSEESGVTVTESITVSETATDYSPTNFVTTTTDTFALLPSFTVTETITVALK